MLRCHITDVKTRRKDHEGGLQQDLSATHTLYPIRIEFACSEFLQVVNTLAE